MKVALYIRIANDDAGNAISYQEQELRRWSNEHGHEVVDVFKDNAPGVLAECFELQRFYSASTYLGLTFFAEDKIGVFIIVQGYLPIFNSFVAA